MTTTITNGVFKTWLKGNDAVEAILTALNNNGSLTSLEIVSRNIGAEGARRLAEALTINNSLKSLTIGFDKIGDEGVRCLAEALTKNDSLKSLSLWDNSISDKGARFLAEALTRNISLTNLYINSDHISNLLKSQIKLMLTKESVLKRKGWNPNNHREWNDNQKQIVYTLTLTRATDNNLLAIMPNELMFYIIAMCM
jgi:Ran GTPase-activating protein (RanGAP) involved in mRNA processing and transport